MKQAARQEIENIWRHSSLFASEQDEQVEQVFAMLSNSNIRTLIPELVLGKIYDNIGFSEIDEKLFRHLVISRLAFPLSKLKTVEYFYRYQGVSLDIDAVYCFLDKLNRQLTQVKHIAYRHTQRILKGYIILGARLKNESKSVKNSITTACPYANGQTLVIDKQNGRRLIVQYSDKRTSKYRYNRERGLKSLEKKITSGRLTKANINNRGYNKYLKMDEQLQELIALVNKIFQGATMRKTGKTLTVLSGSYI